MSESSKVVVILVTAPDAGTAEKIGRTLVEERLAACVNVVPGVQSLYWWQGSVQEDQEVLMLLKARRRDVQAVSARVRELHPYELPEVIAAGVVGGLAAYLSWVESETERGDD